MADAIDKVKGDLFSYVDANNLKNSHAGTSAPTNPTAGVVWYDIDNDIFKIYDGSDWAYLATDRGAPIGSIIPWVGGYFRDGSNGSYTRVLGSANTVAGANAYLNSYNWYVCDGAALNDSDSPIFNGAGRYLPELIGDRFVMGNTLAGGTGGSSTQAHTHDVDLDSKNTEAASTTAVTGGAVTVALGGHVHSTDPANKTSGAATNTENKPLYLSVFYIMKIK